MTNGIPKPIETLNGKKQIEVLFPPRLDWREVGDKLTTGIYPNGVYKGKDAPTAKDVRTYLEKLNYKPIENELDKWDCIERALWGVVHARHRYPGCAVGVAEGNVTEGGKLVIKDGEPLSHAIIVIWEKDLSSFIYYDPSKVSDSLDLVRIEAFPPDVGGDPTPGQPAPIKETLTRIAEGNFMHWKTGYSLYPLKTDPKSGGSWRGVEDFLFTELYNKYCDDINAHSPGPSSDTADPYWTDWDRAFWAYVHVRRSYKGCAIGVAYGRPSGKTSRVVNVLWYKDEKTKEYKYVFWDPRPDLLRELKDGEFVAKTIFF